jgi:hypothetical protein
MKIADFSKGLSTRLDASLIDLAEAVEYLNIDNTAGILKSAKNYTLTSTAVEKWFYLFKGVWYSSALERDYVEYKSKLYFTEDTTYPKKIVNGVEKKLGIDPPPAPLITVEGAAGIISTDPEVLQYVYTYYDSSEGIESAPSNISEELSIGALKQVDISNFTSSSNPAVDLIRLYRVGAGATEFTLITELVNATVTYSDNIPTLNAIGPLLDTIDNQPPLVGLKNLVQAYGILFASIGPTVYFTKVGQPDAWPTTQSISFDNDVTGILPTQDGIFVFTNTKMQLLIGTDIATFAVVPSPGDEQGCNSHKSCKLVKSIPVWSSDDGICAFQGGNITVLSKEKLGKLTLDIVNTTVFDEHYYVTLADGSLFAMDLRFDLAFKEFDFSTNIDINVSNIGKFENTLYTVINGFVATLFTGDDLELNYISPDMTEGDHTIIKLYNNIYIKADGNFRVKILIDNVEVSSETLIGKQIFDVKVPQELQRGSSIQFDIKGRGQIKEIEYKAVGRQNGR